MSKSAVRRDRQRSRTIPYAGGRVFVGIQQQADLYTFFTDRPMVHNTMTLGATPYEATERILGSTLTTPVEYEQISDTNNKLNGILVARPMTRGEKGPFLLNSACDHSRIYCPSPGLKLKGKFSIPCKETKVDMYDGDPMISRITTVEYKGSYTVEPGHCALPPIIHGSQYDPLMIWNGSKSNIPGISLARYNALRELFPKIDEGFSLPLFIKEWTDVRSLMMAACKLVGFLLTMPKVAALIFRFLRREISFQALSNHHLMVQFGVLPLIGDVQKIWKTLVKGQSRINNLCDRAGVSQCVHCQEVIHMDASYASTVREISGVINTGQRLLPPFNNIMKWSSNMTSERVVLRYTIPFYEEVLPETAKYHLTVWYRYEIPEFILGLQGLFLALDQWGLNVSPSVFWQAIPFSFVVDWFYSVRRFLEQYDEKNVELIVSILSVMESVKYDWVRKIPKDLGVRCQFDKCGPWPLDVVNNSMECVLDTDASDDSIARGTNYARWPVNGLPVGDRSEWNMPSGMQMLSGLSLLIQRLGR